MVRVYCVLIGYVFGLFQTAYIIGRLHGIDIRNYGSGNSGTTNMMRTLGTKAGLLTFLGDCLKCIAAVLLVRALFGRDYSEIMPLLTQINAGAGRNIARAAEQAAQAEEVLAALTEEAAGRCAVKGSPE